MSKKHKGRRKNQVTEWGEDFMEAVNSKPVVHLHEKCWQSHPVLTLGKGVFHGASCLHPHEGYDIYVGLDWGMKRQAVYPWHPKPEGQAVEVYFPITDGRVPTDPKEFDAMIDWLAEQLNAGQKVHAGCIGGHGRTGLLLVALVQRMHGNADAGAWVRQHFCKKAVETQEQVEFLKKRYGIHEIQPSRHSEYTPTWGGLSPKHQPNTSQYSAMKGRAIWADFMDAIP